MAPLHERLAQVARLLPPGSAVLLPLESLLEEGQHDNGSDDRLADLTVNEVAKELGRSPSAIRGWCAIGHIPGAYKLRGREWRIPQAALSEFIGRQANKQEPVCTPSHRKRGADLGSWRRLRGHPLGA